MVFAKNVSRTANTARPMRAITIVKRRIDTRNRTPCMCTLQAEELDDRRFLVT
jgi:hypothetical protein